MSKRSDAPLVCCSVVLALALWAGVDARGATDAHVTAEGVLARFSGGQIAVPDMEAAIGNKDLRTRIRLATAEGRLSFLRDLENYDLLALEAERHPPIPGPRRAWSSLTSFSCRSTRFKRCA